jgi:hypothetical protein
MERGELAVNHLYFKNSLKVWCGVLMMGGGEGGGGWRRGRGGGWRRGRGGRVEGPPTGAWPPNRSLEF